MERPFAHQFTTGGSRPIFVRGRALARLFSLFGATLAAGSIGTGSGSASERRSGSIRCLGLPGPINKPSLRQISERTIAG